MTIIDLFTTLPLWCKIIVGLLGFSFVTNVFMISFKASYILKSLERIETFLLQIEKNTRENKANAEDSQKVLSLVLGALKLKGKEE